MTLHEFKLKSDNEQYDIIFNEGQFVTFHLEKSRRFALYAVFKFFVEVEYDIKTNKITGKKSFIDGKLLGRYSDLSKNL